VFAIRPAVQWDGDSPVDIAADGPRPKVFDHIERELQYVGTPVRARVQPRCQRVTESGKIQEKVLGFDELGFLAVDAAARFDEIGGIELVAAGIALVSARAISTANRADTFDVAVRQGAPGGRADGAGRRAFDDVSVAMQSAEKFLNRGVMVACRGARKQVVGQAQSLEIF